MKSLEQIKKGLNEGDNVSKAFGLTREAFRKRDKELKKVFERCVVTDNPSGNRIRGTINMMEKFLGINNYDEEQLFNLYAILDWWDSTIRENEALKQKMQRVTQGFPVELGGM